MSSPDHLCTGIDGPGGPDIRIAPKMTFKNHPRDILAAHLYRILYFQLASQAVHQFFNY